MGDIRFKGEGTGERKKEDYIMPVKLNVRNSQSKGGPVS